MRILTLGIVAGLLWLGITETAHAQRFRGWAGIANQFTNPGSANQGFNANQFTNPGSANQGFNANQFTNPGSFNQGYYGNGYNNGYYGSGYNAGNYYDPANPANRYSNTPTYSYYPSQQVAQPVNRPVPKGEAWIRVILPDPDAGLMFDGLKTSEVGRQRTFTRNTHETGDLNSYTYKVSASWSQGGQPITDARTAVARPGEIVIVDFTQPASPVKLAAPGR